MFNSSIKYQKHTRLGNCDSEIKQQKPMVCFDCNFCSFFLSLAALSLCTQVMQFRRWNRFWNTESTGAQQRHAQVSPPQQEIGTVWKARREKTRYVWWGGGVCRVWWRGVVTQSLGSCFSADSLLSPPLVPPYHLCLSHLKGWLLPLLLSPFVFLTNVAALEGEEMNWSENKYNFTWSHFVLKVKFDHCCRWQLIQKSHLCHNISIRHIEMVNVQFSAMKWNKTQISGSYSRTGHKAAEGAGGSYVFSVRAVRLKWRISWWRGSGFVSVSSSSSSSSSMAF